MKHLQNASQEELKVIKEERTIHGAGDPGIQSMIAGIKKGKWNSTDKKRSTRHMFNLTGWQNDCNQKKYKKKRRRWESQRSINVDGHMKSKADILATHARMVSGGGAGRKHSMIYSNASAYMGAFVRVKSLLAPFHAHPRLRKLDFSRYWSRQKAKSRLISDFVKRMGRAKKIVFFLGDWNQGRRSGPGSKGQVRVPHQMLIDLLQKAGILVYMISEPYTSMRCSKCQIFGQNVEQHWRKVLNPRCYRRKKYRYVKCHGLVRCRRCNTMFCRDLNASVNQLNIAESILAGNGRPAYLCGARAPA